MEGKFSGESRKFFDAETSNEVGKKKNLEWDLNDWKWDGHHFVATPLNPSPSNCKNKQLVANSSILCSEEGRGELEERRKILDVEDDALCGEDGSLSLKLGGHNFVMAEEDVRNNEKNRKSSGGTSSRSGCQAEGCGADMSTARDYHKRHKVCETHAKASSSMVRGVLQRFCQQCSRFHLLEEFDDEKKSCRRRLAGHNKRRRKTHPDTSIGGGSLTDDKASSNLLISLLKVLTNLHSDESDKSRDQDLVSHLLGNISSLGGSFDSRNFSGTLQASQGPSEVANPLLSNGVNARESSRNLLRSPSNATCNIDIQDSLMRSDNHSISVPVNTFDLPSRRNIIEGSPYQNVQAVSSRCSPTLEPARDVLSAEGEALGSLQLKLHADSAETRFRVNDFDLNCTYNETLKDSHQSSLPQTSDKSESSSVHSLSSSNGDVQSRTDRIVFKLFGKDPNDFPPVLRAQILDWLTHTPTDMESYIRPGCIVLSVYLRLDNSIWEELNHNLYSSLIRLLLISGDDFWRKGWIYARLQNRMAFINNGNVVLDYNPLLLKSPNECQIASVTPIAVALSARVSFTVQGFNLAQPNARLLCAFEGRYVGIETTNRLLVSTNPNSDGEGYQYISFSCSLPDALGRGVIEIEDHGISGNFFPFVVAEEDVCCEIRTLENSIKASCDDILARNQALNFLNEMGWLLRRSHLNSYRDHFSLKRFRWLVTFSIDREWCAVIKKLLDVLFQGAVDLCGCTASELALSENLLHAAVKQNKKLMVKFLVAYKVDKASNDTASDRFLFRPDMLGLSDTTPLHIAASINDAEGVLDALLEDPGQYGIKAWNTARDSTGFTPEDYARARGHLSYILLVQNKINNAKDKSQVVLNISEPLSDVKQASFNIERSRLRQTHYSSCKLCDGQQLADRTPMSRSLLYRPLMLSMVGIAAVCVCVGLLFKGPPEVTFVHAPFRWEALHYGTM